MRKLAGVVCAMIVFCVIGNLLMPRVQVARNSGFWERTFEKAKRLSRDLYTSEQTLREFKFSQTHVSDDRFWMGEGYVEVSLYPVSLVESHAAKDLHTEPTAVIAFFVLPSSVLVDIESGGNANLRIESSHCFDETRNPNVVCVMSDMSVKAIPFKALPRAQPKHEPK